MSFSYQLSFVCSSIHVHMYYYLNLNYLHFLKFRPQDQIVCNLNITKTIIQCIAFNFVQMIVQATFQELMIKIEQNK